MYDVTWVSSKTLTVDGQYSYSIIVTTVTNSDPVIGTFTIAQPSNPVVLYTTTVKGRRVVRATPYQTSVIRCSSSGGYPRTLLGWYKGTSNTKLGATSAVLETDKTYTVTNEYSFKPSRGDDRTAFRCMSYYPVTGDIPKNTTTELYLYLNPTRWGYRNFGTVAAGSPSNGQCEAAGARPAAAIAMIYRGQTISPTVSNSEDHVTETFTTISTFNRQLQRDDNGQLLRCIVPHQTLHHSLTKSTTISVQFPPTNVSIAGNQLIIANGQNLLTLTCTTDTANPYPTVIWQNGNINITAGVSQSDRTGAYGGRIAEGKLQFIHTRDMDGDVIWCSAENALNHDSPVRNFTTLDLLFRPLAVHITGNEHIEANGHNRLNLICETESCYPAATIKWKNGSKALPNGSQVTENSGIYGGSNYSQTLTLILTRYMDGDVISCEGSNSQSGNQSVSSSVRLNLKYHPSTTVDEAPIKTVTEGQPDVSLTCRASSKPAASFKWYKGTDTTPLKSGSGSVDNNMLIYTIDTIEKTDAGNYRCTADNGIGTADNSNGNVKVVVQYPPVITISASNTTENDTVAEIVCGASGVPAKYTFLDWKQKWLDTDDVIRETISPVATDPTDRQVLTLVNPSYQDTGVYSCGATNNIARWGTSRKEMRSTVYLVIKSRPVITKPSSRKEDPYKVWTSLNKPFSVNVSFYSNIPYSEAVVYKMDESIYLTRATDVFIQTKDEIVDLPVYGKLITTWGYTCSLTYTMTQVEDFGEYLMKIPNEIGTTDFYFKIVPEGPPCTPVEPAIDSNKINDVTVSWIRCSHGGHAQTFVIQYSNNNKVWINGTSKDGGLSSSRERINSTIENLASSTLYYIRLYSYNTKGSSEFTELLNVTTREQDLDTSKIGSSSTNTSAVVGGVIGAALVALISGIVIGVIVIRYRKALSRAKGDQHVGTNVRNYDNVQSTDTPPDGYASLTPSSTYTYLSSDPKLYEDLNSGTRNDHVYSRAIEDVQVDEEHNRATYSNLTLRK